MLTAGSCWGCLHQSLQGQLDEERRSRQEEKDALSTELSFVKEELRSLQDEGRELKRRALDAEDELAKAKAVVTNVTLEAKVANRRNVNIIKDLKSQLKREAAKFDQAQVRPSSRLPPCLPCFHSRADAA